MSENEALDDFSGGDLGLGDGLKPGGIPISAELCCSNSTLGTKLRASEADGQDQSNESTGFTTPEDSEDEYEISLTPIRAIQELKQQYKSNTPKNLRCVETLSKIPEDGHNIYDCRYFQVRSCECQNGDLGKTHICECEKDGQSSEHFPVYADVPMGTSLRQQRELFQHNMEELSKKKGGSGSSVRQSSDQGKGNKGSTPPSSKTQEEIAMKLAQTLQEVEDLKLELDTCEKRLDSKYRAIDILKKQATEAQLQLKNSETVARERTIKLAQEINALQFELQWKESSILDSQTLWADRFNRRNVVFMNGSSNSQPTLPDRDVWLIKIESNSRRQKLQYSGDGPTSRVTSLVVGKEQDLGEMSHMVFSASGQSKPTKTGEKGTKNTVPLGKHKRVCQENAYLVDGLQNRTEELRKVTAQKMAIERENDELLALLDIQERAKYEKTWSVSSDENYNTFTSSELAVLGACRCRVSDPDPCRCAHAAASLKKEVFRMKEEVSQFKNRRDEAFLTVDAYRKAFEEQLQKNRTLTMQLAAIASNSQSKAAKAKSAFRWLIGSLDDDDDVCDENGKQGPLMAEHEIIAYLTDLVNEKREVLAHQKLASQILGDKVRHLEDKLSRYEKDSEVFS